MPDGLVPVTDRTTLLQMIAYNTASSSGGGGAPSGPAGGDLGGTYPNPTVPELADAVTVDNTGLITSPITPTAFKSANGISTDLRGNLLFVDAVNGNDATGARGTTKAFLTLTAAKTAATSGDTIVVYPGTYNEQELLKNGVNWHFFNGAIVNYTGIDAGSIFSDNAEIVSSAITGYGIFINTCTGDNEDPVVEGNVVEITQTDSNVSIDCLQIRNDRDTEFSGSQSGAISHLNGSLKVRANYVYSKQGTAITWYDGPGFFDVDEIRADTLAALYSFLPDTPAGGDWYVRADHIVGSINITGFSANTSRQWFEALDILGGVQVAAGNVYVNSERLRIDSGALITMPPASGTGKLWVNVVKLLHGDAPSTFNNGTAFINAQQSDRVAGSGVSINGGIVNWSCVRDVIPAGINGFDLVSGTLRLSRSAIDATLASSNSPITKAGGTLILDDVTLISEATRKCIEVSSAQTVIVYGARANTAVSTAFVVTQQVETVIVNANVT